MKTGGVLIKSSTYAGLVTIVFLQHRAQISKSIESVIRTTDAFAIRLGIENNLSHMTKYRIIRELLESRILVTRKTNKNRKLKLAQPISDLF